jgi:hypothetical protein
MISLAKGEVKRLACFSRCCGRAGYLKAALSKNAADSSPPRRITLDKTGCLLKKGRHNIGT